MRSIAMALVLAVFACFLACSGDGGKQLYETAKFEEVQNNRDHARELYEDILKKYPGSEYAKKAEEGLNALKEKK
jgi:TolA-binding protein